MHVGAALIGGAPRGFLLRLFKLFDADQFFLEGLRRARIVANLVAAVGIRHRDVLVAAGKLDQHFADVPDRTADRHRAEYGCAGEDEDDEQAKAEVEPVDESGLRVGFGFAPFGGFDQRGGGRLDQGVHLAAQFVAVFDVFDRIGMAFAAVASLPTTST